MGSCVKGIILFHLTNFMPFIAPEFKSQRLTLTHTFRHTQLFMSVKACRIPSHINAYLLPLLSLSPSYAPCMDLNPLSLPLFTSLRVHFPLVCTYVCFYYTLVVFLKGFVIFKSFKLILKYICSL